MLEIRDISFSYDNTRSVLQGASAVFKAGKVTALLGNNGSGKTTLMKLIAGIRQPDSGSLLYDGNKIAGGEITAYKRVFGFMPEILQLYGDMRASEVLSYLAQLKRVPPGTGDQLLERVGLGDHTSERVATFSKGMKQRLNLAQALLGDPKVLVFDEPFNGFDSAGMVMFFDVLRSLAKEGAVVLISSHQLAAIVDHVDEIAVLSDGRVVRHASVEQVVGEAAERPKKTWLHFASDVSDYLGEIAAEISSPVSCSEGTIVSGVLSGEDVGRIVLKVAEQQVHLRSIRVESRELSDVLAAVE